MLTFDLEGWNAEEKVDRIKLHVNICVQAKVFLDNFLIEISGLQYETNYRI